MNKQFNPDFGKAAAEIIDHGLPFVDQKRAILGGYVINAGNRGFDGFQIDKPLDEVEISDV